MNSIFNPENQNKTIDGKIVAALERISESFRVLLWEKAKIVKLSPIQIQILIFIKYHKPEFCTVNYLAEEFNMSPPTISDAVKILIQKNLIKKITNSTDKRISHLYLTRKGEKVFSEAGSFVQPLLKTVTKLNSAEKEILLSSLLQIINELNSQEIVITQRMCFTCVYLKKEDGEFYCNLLEMKLKLKDLRIDCPEHQAIS
ncbi:MAG: MarR family winged helix-turn-helix transcriptional regulator [Ignavibacteria bacterium]